jgi:DHA3 family macrolide efflux protein-like MFS transporter
MKSMFLIFRNRNYALLFSANFTSQMGSIIGLTAFMYYFLDRFSKQPSYATITELMYSLPVLAVFWIVGVLADRMDRKKIASNSDFISAILSIILLIAAQSGEIVLIFGLLFLRSAVLKFFQPAQQALIQGILREDEYTVAAGLNQMVSSMFMLFGSAIGILVYWKLGLNGAILIDALSFIISGILIRCCSIGKEVRLPNGYHDWRKLDIKTVLLDFKKGFIYIVNYRLLLSLVFGFFIFGIVNGGLAVMPAFIMKYKLAPDTYETVMIWVGIVFGIGMLLGSMVAFSIAPKFKLYQLIVSGLILTGIFLALTGFSTNIYVYFTLDFIVAFFLPFINIGIGGWMPRIIDPKMMGRVQGCVSPLNMLSQSLTLGIIAFTFPRFISIEGLFATVGTCLTVVGLFYWYTLPKFSMDQEVLKQEDSLLLEPKLEKVNI